MAGFIAPAIGGLASLIGGLISSRSKPKEAKVRQIPRFSPQQSGFQNQILSMLGPASGAGLSNLTQLLSGDPEAFKAFEAPFQRQFKEQTIPYLAERFSGLGAGAQSSSAFQQALGQAGSGLSENLASLRGGLQQNALSQLLGFGQLGMEPQFESVLQNRSPGFGSTFGPALGEMGGNLFSSGLSNLFKQGDQDNILKSISEIMKKYQG